MSIIKNLVFRIVISIYIAYTISLKVPSYDGIILIGGSILLFFLLTAMSKKF